MMGDIYVGNALNNLLNVQMKVLERFVRDKIGNLWIIFVCVRVSSMKILNLIIVLLVVALLVILKGSVLGAI